MKKIAIILTLLSIAILPLFAINHDGKWLLNGLITTNAVQDFPKSGIPESNMYVGYIIGVAEMDMEIGVVEPIGDVTYKDSIIVVEDYLKNHPLLLDEPANLLISKALSDKWPGPLMKEKPFTPPPVVGKDGT